MAYIDVLIESTIAGLLSRRVLKRRTTGACSLLIMAVAIATTSLDPP